MSASGRRTGWLVPVLLAVVVLGAAAVWMIGAGGDGDGDRAAGDTPIEVAASGPRFGTLEQLVAASDLVVEATVVGDRAGRTISDPADPGVGVVTRLYDLDVHSTFVGSVGDALVVEQESTLLDGTPIVVNGLSAHHVGSTAIWFLVAGADEQFPYTAVVNEQGRIDIADDGIVEVLGAATDVDGLRSDLAAIAATTR